MAQRFLPGVPGPKIEAMYDAAPGREIESGSFDSPASSARLAANTFGFFLDRPEALPPLPGCEDEEWPATYLSLEETVRFPWRGGRHPVLDVLIRTPSALIGIEAKRYEPFRAPTPVFSDAFWRPKWGDRMDGYQRIRDSLHVQQDGGEGLHGAQLVKHALALRAESHRDRSRGQKPILLYLYAEPATWPSREPVEERLISAHREEVEAFAKNVEGDEVRFLYCTYRKLLSGWQESASADIQEHAERVLRCFSP